jgi:hypothetical protein
MARSFRFASFNVENLFERARVFNFRDKARGDDILAKVDVLRDLLSKDTYADADKKEILRLYKDELKPYIVIRQDRGKLFSMRGWSPVAVAAGGSDDWDGTIEFKPAPYDEVAREATAHVIKDTRAHVACIVEAESRPTLKAFDSHLLNNKYKFEMLIDGNDQRGIDVGLYSKYPLGRLQTHMFDKDGRKTVFSRDCLEVEVLVPDGQSLHVLCNHFKSRGYDYRCLGQVGSVC